MPPDDSDSPVIYEVRLTEPAEMEVDTAFLGRMRFGQKQAERWYADFLKELDSLSTFPRRYPVAPDSEALGGGVRQLLYGKGGMAYRIMYRIIEPSGDESGIVRVLHFRHAAQRYFGEEDT